MAAGNANDTQDTLVNANVAPDAVPSTGLEAPMADAAGGDAPLTAPDAPLTTAEELDQIAKSVAHVAEELASTQDMDAAGHLAAAKTMLQEQNTDQAREAIQNINYASAALERA